VNMPRMDEIGKKRVVVVSALQRSTWTGDGQSPARLVTALERASAEGTPFPDPDMSSPSSSLPNFSFIRSMSARNATT
jgi:hypothetical protein